MKKIITYIAVLASLTLSACDNEPDIWKTQTHDFNGTWEVEVLEDGEKLVSHDDEGQIYIYNTNTDNNNIWIEDNALIGFKVKATTNIDALTFSGDIISNGKIIKDGVKVKPQYLLGDPVTADSIYFEAVVEYDGQNHNVIFQGYRHTGWEVYLQ